MSTAGTSLRPYQVRAIEAVFAAWLLLRSFLLVAPTGSGKSRMFSAAAQRFRLETGQRVLILAGRRALVKQAAENIRQHTTLLEGVPIGAELEMATRRVDRRAPPLVVCASVATMAARLGDFRPDAFGLVIVDEADLAMAKTYRQVIDHFPGAKVLGVTASPKRHDGKALGELFEADHTIPIAPLIQGGHLAPVRAVTVKILDLHFVDEADHDLDNKALERVLLAEQSLHEVVAATLAHAGARPTIVFAKSIAHGRALAEVFNRPAYRRVGCARMVKGESTAAGERANDETIEAFKRGEFQFLVSCQLIGRGVDIPPVACVAMASPTASWPSYYQKLGRGTRPADGKSDLLVLDFTDSSERHDIMTAVDALGGDASPEVRERAKELVEAGDRENPVDVLGAIGDALEALAVDPVLLGRIRAKVASRLREVRQPIDWEQHREFIATHTVKECMERWGASVGTIDRIRKRLGIRQTPEQRRARAVKASAALASEHRLASLANARAAQTQDQHRAMGVAMNERLTTEQRVAAAKIAAARKTPAQHRAAAISLGVKSGEARRAKAARASAPPSPPEAIHDPSEG